MNKITIQLGLGIASILAIGLLVFGIMSFQAKTVKAGAPSGLPATMATTSSVIVGPGNAMTLFATSTACATRVISTVAQPIMLTFTDNAGQSPTGIFGHLQAASTTVDYDSGLYGCGLVKAYGFVASTTITISESR